MIYETVENETRVNELREGKKYGRNFVQYAAEEVNEITNTDFLHEIYFALHSTGQPNDEYEMELLNRLLAVISDRIDELRK